QIKLDKFAKGPELYQPPAVVRWRSEPAHGGTNRRFNGQNPPRGAQIYYSLPTNAQKVSVRIVDIAGQTLRELPAKNQAGLNRASWDLRATPPQMNNTAQTQPPPTRPSGEGQRAVATRTGGGRGFVTAAPVPAGTYRIVLSVDGKELAQTLHVQPDPVVSDAVTADEDENASEEQEEEEEMEREQEHQREIHEYENIG